MGRSREADGSAVLEACNRFIRAWRLLPQFGHYEPDLKRDALSARVDGPAESNKTWRRVSRRRARTELYVYGRAQAPDGDHFRYSTRESRHPVDVQSDL